MTELPERLEVLVDEDVEHEEREGRCEGEEGEGHELVVDDKVSRPKELPVPQVRYVVLQGRRSIVVSDDASNIYWLFGRSIALSLVMRYNGLFGSFVGVLLRTCNCVEYISTSIFYVIIRQLSRIRFSFCVCNL